MNENILTLIDILEDTELNFKYSVCLVAPNIFRTCLVDRRYIYYDVEYGNRPPFNSHNRFSQMRLYQIPIEVKDQNFNLIRIQFKVDEDNPSIIQNSKILESSKMKITYDPKFQTNPIFERIQKLTQFTLISICQIKSYQPVGIDYIPGVRWDKPKKFLILDFTHESNLIPNIVNYVLN